MLRNLTFIILIFFCPWVQAGWLNNNDPLQPVSIYGLRVINSLTVGGTSTFASVSISNGTFAGDGSALGGVLHSEIDPVWSAASSSYVRTDADGSAQWHWGVMEFCFDGTNPPAAYPYRIYGSTGFVVAGTLCLTVTESATCTVYVGTRSYTETWGYTNGSPETKTFAISNGFAAGWPGIVVTAALAGAGVTIHGPLLVNYRWKP